VRQETSKATADTSDEVAALIETLIETERRLAEITRGEVDTVVGSDGRPFLLGRAQEQLRYREAERQAAILNALPANIALLDAEGTIISVNEAWRCFAGGNGLHAPGHVVGLNYIKVCEQTHGDCSMEANHIASGIRAVLSGREKSYGIEYPCHSSTQQRWFQLTVTPLAEDHAGGVVVMHMNVTARKAAEETLRASEANLSAAQRISHLGSWEQDLTHFADASANGLRWSDEMYRIAGYEPGACKVTSEFFFQLVPLPEREAIHKAFAAAVRERRQYSIVHHLIRPNGEVRIVHETAQISFDDATGQALHVRGVCQDITETKLAEAVLVEREERLRAALSASGAGTFRWEFRSNELCWDRSLDALFGLLPGRTVQSLEAFIALVHPDDRPLLIDRCERCKQEGADFSMEYRILWPDGSQRWLDDRGKTFLDPAGKPIYMTGACVDITERKLAELEIRESNEKFHQLADNISDAFWIRSPDFSEVQYVSPAFEKIWGRSVESLKANPHQWTDLIFAEDRARVLKGFSELTDNAPSLDIEYRIVRPDGELRWVRVRGFQIRNAANQLIRHIGVVTDIDERRKATDALRASEEEFRTLSEAMPQFVWVTRPDGWTVYLNRQWTDYTGRTIEESLGQGWLQSFHAEDQAAALNAWREATATNTPFSMETRIQRADGVYRWWLCRAIPLIDPAGGVLKWIGTGTDINDLKLAQQQMSQQAALLDIAQDAILVKDLENRIIYWNKGAERTYGWTSEEAIGASSLKLLQQDAVAHREARDSLLAHGSWNSEMVSRSKAGSEIIADVCWTLVKDPQGQTTSFLAIHTDITGKKKLEAQFLRVQRMESIGTLASGIAHDLNNVLAPIMMSMEMLKDIALRPEDKSLLVTLQSCAERGANLIKQVLSFARGVEGRRVPVNVIHIIHDIENIIRDTFPKNISFQMKRPREVGIVLGDPTQLHQVLMNLCVNSRDAMPLGGKLTVTLENVVVDELYANMNPDAKAGPYTMIKVTDTGSGIPLAIQHKIFEPFYTTKELGKGTGLGLSTTTAIIKSHNGFISLYSEPGKGAQFKVYLPAVLNSTAVKEKEVRQTLLPPGDGELILVVDDDESIREITQKTLERFNYRVMLARNGAEAVAAYARHGSEIAVVLTDMAMPIMDGPALIVALMALNPSVKIIGCSGHASNHSVAHAMGAGVQYFIPKPYPAEILLKTLRLVFKKEAESPESMQFDTEAHP
jgi:PAS domain S-box-containing protein